ncbi:MAG: hypothetical protein M0P91_04675 [Sulfuricurvum sp.]|jgi:hypothetical protein|uniref:hypothetical protein n=1 Tax=Sulfuricurvum sp. TaxID=2025608 RepID=UPI0025E484A9|nr:hypothetical protein [Sulfuricurvum sp.]MCK9372470.1 hypothetical protein [Sulfuricurvum sp.]
MKNIKKEEPEFLIIDKKGDFISEKEKMVLDFMHIEIEEVTEEKRFKIALVTSLLGNPYLNKEYIDNRWNEYQEQKKIMEDVYTQEVVEKITKNVQQKFQLHN